MNGDNMTSEMPQMAEQPAVEPFDDEPTELDIDMKPDVDDDVPKAEFKPESTRAVGTPKQMGERRAIQAAREAGRKAEEIRKEKAGAEINRIVSEAPGDLQSELIEIVAFAEEEDTDPEKILLDVKEKVQNTADQAEVIYTKIVANLPVKAEEIDDIPEETAEQILNKFIEMVMQEPENITAKQRQIILNIFQQSEPASAEEAFETDGEPAEIPPDISKKDALMAISNVLAA